MELHLKYDIQLACKIILQENLERIGIDYRLTDNGTVELTEAVSVEQFKKLAADLKKYGIELIDNSINIIVQQTKEAIQEIVYSANRPASFKLSEFISKKLNLSYSYLSKVFSEETGISIENHMIMQRIERVKQLLTENRYTITEIAWKLNYSSVAHLSNQFKKTTGITPTLYQRMLSNRYTDFKQKMGEADLINGHKTEVLKKLNLVNV